MAISFLVLFAVPGCFSCNARIVPTNRAKIVEEYVVSANFDSNTNFPQLNDRSQRRDIYQEDERLAPSASRGSHGGPGEPQGAFGALEDREFLVPHHLPPAPPPPGLAYAPALFAVGLITFLILLNSLQTSLLLLKSKGSILGPVSGVLGRRKRFASENLEKFIQNHERKNGSSTLMSKVLHNA